MDQKILELVQQMIDLKKTMFQLVQGEVEEIIERKIQDRNKIERTLDALLDCYYDEESMQYYIRLCEYYGTINPEGEKIYKKFLKESME